MHLPAPREPREPHERRGHGHTYKHFTVESTATPLTLQLNKPLIRLHCRTLLTFLPAVAAPEFFDCRAQPGHQNLDWGIFKKICVAPLFLVAASYMVRKNSSTHGRNSSFM